MDFNVNSTLNNWFAISLAWWVFAVVTIFNAPYHQGFQLHYLSVAWEMFRNHDYLMTYVGGQIDLEKTPLFYWLIVGGWHVFGVHDGWPRILTFSIGWINLLLTWWLARQLFADKLIVAWIAVLVLACSLYWPIFASEIRFENLVTLFGLLFLNFLLKASQTNQSKWWIFASISFGFALFSKGPVVFIYFLPFALTIPYWLTNIIDKNQWYLKLTGVILGSLIIPLPWVFLVAKQHGLTTIHYLIFGQIQQRISFFDQFFNNFKQGIKVLAVFPLRWLPWIILPILWLQLKKWRNFADRKFFLLLFPSLLVLLFFSLLVKMQFGRYLIPIFPFVAILISIILCAAVNISMPRMTMIIYSGLYIFAGLLLLFAPHLPIFHHKFPAMESVSAIWAISMMSGGILLLIFQPRNHWQAYVLIGAVFFFELTLYQLGWQRMLIKPMDIEAVAERLKNLPNKQNGLIQFGAVPAKNNFEFLARLQQPLSLLNPAHADARQWLLAHPDGWIILSVRELPKCQQLFEWWQLRQNRKLILLPVSHYNNCIIH